MILKVKILTAPTVMMRVLLSALHQDPLAPAVFRQDPSGISKDRIVLEYRASINIVSYVGCALPAGIQVCRDAFLNLLGIGRDRLARTKKSFRGQDLRSMRFLAK